MTPQGRYVLEGVSRQTVIDLARAMKLEVVERDLDPYDAATADEIFLTSTSLCLCGVSRFNGAQVADGKTPGPITKQSARCLFRDDGMRHRRAVSEPAALGTEKAMRNLSLEAAVADVDARYVAANPRSKARFEAAARDMPGGNTRTVLHYDPFPVALVKGEGAYVTDLDGHTYVDFLGEFTAGLYGHSEPAILRAIQEALANGLVLGGPNRYEARLAELMCQRFPALELVRFCNSGSESTLMSLSLARAVTGRASVMAFNGAYHGGFLSFAGGGSPINAPFPYVMADYNDPEGARKLIAQHAPNLAAIIIEPMMGSGGCIPADPEFLRLLREEADKHGIVLVFDEVMTSRLAPGGLHGKLGVKPDLVAFGKYLGGGVSFGAFGGDRALMQRLDPTRPDGLDALGLLSTTTC